VVTLVYGLILGGTYIYLNFVAMSNIPQGG